MWENGGCVAASGWGGFPLANGTRGTVAAVRSALSAEQSRSRVIKLVAVDTEVCVCVCCEV